MWIVKDGEVGQSTPDAELPIMLCQRHVEFHDVGPTMGQYQLSFQYQQFCGITPMLAQLWPRNISPTIIIHTLGHRWSNVVNPTDQKMTLGQQCVAIWEIITGTYAE